MMTKQYRWRADLALEREDLEADSESEHAELSTNYVYRGLDAGLAKEDAA